MSQIIICYDADEEDDEDDEDDDGRRHYYKIHIVSTYVKRDRGDKENRSMLKRQAAGRLKTSLTS